MSGGAPQMFDSRAFIREVKEALANEPEKYSQFVGLMRAFNRGTGTPQDCVPKLGALFEGHDELIGGLNRCLPSEYHIDTRNPSGPVAATQRSEHLAYSTPDSLQSGATVPLIRVGSAHDVIQRAKATMETADYRRFIDAMRKVRRTPDAYDEVLAMLKPHPELEAEFEELLPRPVVGGLFSEPLPQGGEAAPTRHSPRRSDPHAAAVASSEAREVGADQSLGEVWEKIETPGQRPYYFNTTTRAIAFTDPTAVGAAA